MGVNVDVFDNFFSWSFPFRTMNIMTNVILYFDTILLLPTQNLVALLKFSLNELLYYDEKFQVLK